MYNQINHDYNYTIEVTVKCVVSIDPESDAFARRAWWLLDVDNPEKQERGLIPIRPEQVGDIVPPDLAEEFVREQLNREARESWGKTTLIGIRNLTTE